MNSLPYYKRYPRDLIEGTVGMPFEEKVTYAFVLDLIYLQNGKLPDDARYIAGVLGISTRKWNSIRGALVARGKIVVGDGFLTNDRADIELETLAKFQDKQAERARGPRKNNDIEKPRHSHTDPDTLAKAKDADGVMDFNEAIWTRGVSYLVRNGVKERSARSILGKWKSQHGDRAVFDALGAANRAGAPDPVAYISAALKPKPSVADQKLETWGIGDAQPVRVEPGTWHRDAEASAGATDLPRVQREPEGSAPEDPMSFGDANGGWLGGSLPSLRVIAGGVL